MRRQKCTAQGKRMKPLCLRRSDEEEEEDTKTKRKGEEAPHTLVSTYLQHLRKSTKKTGFGIRSAAHHPHSTTTPTLLLLSTISHTILLTSWKSPKLLDPEFAPLHHYPLWYLLIFQHLQNLPKKENLDVEVGYAEDENYEN